MCTPRRGTSKHGENISLANRLQLQACVLYHVVMSSVRYQSTLALPNRICLLATSGFLE